MLKNGDLMPVDIARIGNPRAADRIAEPIVDVVDLAAQQRGHRDVGAHLNKLYFRSVLKVKTAVLRDKRNQKRQGAGSNRNAYFLGRALSWA